MPDWLLLFVIGVLSYLWGSLSPSRLIGKVLLPGQPLDDTSVELPGSDNVTLRYYGVSATAVGAKLGPAWGVTIGLLDGAKVILPMWLVNLAWPDSSYPAWVALAAMVGHIWPLYHGFRGGRGQSILLGAALFLDPLSVIVCMPLGVIVGVFVLRDMFVTYTLGPVFLIVWFAIFGSGAEVAFAIAANLLYVIASLPEAREYLQARAEGRIGKMERRRDIFTTHPALGRKPPRDPDDQD